MLISIKMRYLKQTQKILNEYCPYSSPSLQPGLFQSNIHTANGDLPATER